MTCPIAARLSCGGGETSASDTARDAPRREPGTVMTVMQVPPCLSGLLPLPQTLLAAPTLPWQPVGPQSPMPSSATAALSPAMHLQLLFTAGCRPPPACVHAAVSATPPPPASQLHPKSFCRAGLQLLDPPPEQLQAGLCARRVYSFSHPPSSQEPPASKTSSAMYHHARQLPTTWHQATAAGPQAPPLR